MKMSEENSKEVTENKSGLLPFLLPSLVGIFFFLIPVEVDGRYTIPLGVITDGFTAALGPSMIYLVFAILIVSAVAAVLVSWLKVDIIPKSSFLRPLAEVSTPWVILRLLGVAFVYSIYSQVGPEPIWNENTGGVVLNDLIYAIIAIFLFAPFFMSCLTDYGFMEFVGASMRSAFRTLFRLPGRSAVDAIASWLSGSAVAVIITSKQYTSGYYSSRESAAIATNFSITSLPFCLFVTEFIGLGHMFIPIYLILVAVGIVTAMIMVRIPPLGRMSDEYVEGVGKQIHESLPEGQSVFGYALSEAKKRGAAGPGFVAYLKSAVHTMLDVWLGLVPAVAVIGTSAMVIAEYTPIFTYMAAPLVPILELMAIPEAAAAAPTLLVGFIDMFLPAVIGTGIESELTRFVIVIVSLSQLIYMSEVGILMIRSPIPVNFWFLLKIYLLRTAIILPMAAAIGHVIY